MPPAGVCGAGGLSLSGLRAAQPTDTIAPFATTLPTRVHNTDARLPMPAMDKQDAELLARVRRHIEDDPEFTEQEVQLLRQVLDAYRSILALGKLGKWLVGVLATMTALVVSWESITKGIKQWLTS